MPDLRRRKRVYRPGAMRSPAIEHGWYLLRMRRRLQRYIMNIPRRPCDLASIERNTHQAQQWYEMTAARIELMDNDLDREKRHAESECHYCYVPYGAGRQGNSSGSLCGLCGGRTSSPSPCADVLCLDCAKANNLCKHCGGDVDMKRRRRTGQPMACKKGGE